MKNISAILKSIFAVCRGRAFFLYAITVILLWPLTTFPWALEKARSAALSRFIPNYEYILNFRDGRVALDKEQFRDYLSYFKKVDAYVPDKSDVLSLLGYCYYYLGNDNMALKYFQRAVLGYRECFAFNYNLGAMAFKKGEYQAAVKHLQYALKINFVQNVKFITSSRIYYPLFRSPKDIDRELKAYMKLGYERCYTLLVSSYAKLNDPANELAFAVAALTIAPADPSFFYFHAGTSAAKLGEYKQAINFLTSCLNRHPDNAEAVETLAHCLFALGQNQLAERMMLRAQELKESGVDDEFKIKIDMQLF